MFRPLLGRDVDGGGVAGLAANLESVGELPAHDGAAAGVPVIGEFAFGPGYQLSRIASALQSATLLDVRVYEPAHEARARVHPVSHACLGVLAVDESCTSILMHFLVSTSRMGTPLSK